MPMINEAINTLHEGVADVEAIDTIMKLGMAHLIGPCNSFDFIGLDVCLPLCRFCSTVLETLNMPLPIAREYGGGKKLGIKAGEGFYNYSQVLRS